MKGLDICSQQGKIDFSKVKAAGVDFIIPRCGRGITLDLDGMDYRFLEYCREAPKAGIQIPGVYHFIFVHSMDDALKNAQKAVECVKKAGLPKSTIIWCDQEEKTVIDAVEHGFNLTTDLQRRVTEIFCDYVLSQGYCAGVYLNMDYIRRVYGQDIVQKYDIWLDDHTNATPDYPCLYKQTNWRDWVNGINTYVDADVWVGTYTAGTARPKEVSKVGLVDKYIDALETYGDGRYHYWDGRAMGIGCSEYTRLALVKAGIISPSETFNAASGVPGPLADKSRFQRIEWNPNSLRRGDILWSTGHHVATWDGNQGVYEAAPEGSHGICDNGRTGVGHWSHHTYRNCGTGTMSWTCIYRIIDPGEVKKEMDKKFNVASMAKYLPVIRSGYTGDMCKALQTIMSHYGWYDDAIDGICGAHTVAGIKFLQTALKVDADGSFGPKSWAALLS